MSEGKFLRGFYEAEDNAVYSCRYQPETVIGSTNPLATGPATVQGSAALAGTRRRFGVNARRIRLKWQGAAPDGYDPNGIITIPIFTKAAFALIKKDDVVTYQGVPAVVVGKTPEYVN